MVLICFSTQIASPFSGRLLRIQETACKDCVWLEFLPIKKISFLLTVSSLFFGEKSLYQSQDCSYHCQIGLVWFLRKRNGGSLSPEAHRVSKWHHKLGKDCEHSWESLGIFSILKANHHHELSSMFSTHKGLHYFMYFKDICWLECTQTYKFTELVSLLLVNSRPRCLSTWEIKWSLPYHSFIIDMSSECLGIWFRSHLFLVLALTFEIDLTNFTLYLHHSALHWCFMNAMIKHSGLRFNARLQIIFQSKLYYFHLLHS